MASLEILNCKKYAKDEAKMSFNLLQALIRIELLKKNEEKKNIEKIFRKSSDNIKRYYPDKWNKLKKQIEELVENI
jgi:ribosomal protein S8